MAAANWLADQQGLLAEQAMTRILDAAAQLFTDHDPAAIGMREIARAAGCSRATLYRYFDSREALYTAYMHRWALTVSEQLTARLAGVDDPHQRLITAIAEAMALVRANPSLAAWFEHTGAPIGAAMADQSAVVTTIAAAFLATLEPEGAAPPEVFERRARWLVRILTSLLTFPGRDAAEERALLEEFVIPVVAPTTFRT